MKISATFNVTFQITDRDLYDTFESDNSEWVNFLTAVLDSVRYSEDWTKKLVSTEGDELYWDEDEDHGEAQVDVTIEIDFEDNLEWYSNWASDMKDSWEVTLPDDASEFEATTFLNLVAPPNETPYRNAGPLWSIVRWGTLIPEYNDGDGCFLEYEGEEQDMYLEGIRNLPERMFFSSGQFTDAAGNDFNVYGSDAFEDFYVEPA